MTSVSLARSTFSDQERVTVTAPWRTAPTRRSPDDSLTLEIGGRGIQTEPLNVRPEGSASVAFQPFTVPSRNMRVSVRAGNDALPTDNVFNFVVVAVGSGPHHCRGRRHEAGRRTVSDAALSIGDVPHFDTFSARRPNAVSDDDLRRASVVLLNDVDVPPGSPAASHASCRTAAALFVAGGPSGDAGRRRPTCFPRRCRSRSIARAASPRRVGALEYGHPVFEFPRAAQRRLLLGAFLRVPLRDGALPTSQVLARFDAGTPALVERKLGSGRVLLWASTLDSAWSDLPLKPVFLPFMHRSMVHLANYTEPAPWLTIGQVFDPGAASAKAQATGRLALTPSGSRLPLEDEGSSGPGPGADRAGLLRDSRAEGELRRDRRRQQRRSCGVGPDAVRSGRSSRPPRRNAGQMRNRPRPTCR